MFKAGEKTSVNALQTYPYISLIFFYLNLKKKHNCKSWKVPYVIKTSQSVTGHHRICCGVGGGSDLLDTWNTPIREDYFSKERLCHLFLPWEGCSFLERFVSFESGLWFFPQMNFIDCVFNFSIPCKEFESVMHFLSNKLW